MVSDDLIIALMVCTLFVEIRLLWLNYKGRFRYRLFEVTGIWRRTDEALDIVSLFLHPLSFLVMFITLRAILSPIAGLSVNESTAIILAFIFGDVLIDGRFDHDAVSNFEEHCLKCPNTKDCQAFNELKCSIVARKRWAEAANRPCRFCG